MSGVHPIPMHMIQRVDDPSLMLRLNQRITAEILEVTNNQVLLALQGARVVAKLTSSDQAAELQQHQIAQFQVRGFENGTLTLQLAAPVDAAATAEQLAPELIPSILQQLNVPNDPKNIIIAEALLAQGEAVTPNAVQALRDALSAFNSWERSHAQAAAALYSGGVPINHETIQLQMESTRPLQALTVELATMLGRLPSNRLPPSARHWLSVVLQNLASAQINLGSTDNTANQLVAFFNLVSRPLENDLARAMDTSSIPESDNMLYALHQLKSSLEAGPDHLASVITLLENTIEALEHIHLTNIPRATPTGEATPLEFAIPLLLPALQDGMQEHTTAHLHIDRDATSTSNQPSLPVHIRLRVELAEGDLDINLTFHERKVAALIAANTEALHAAAENELSSLTMGLEKQGFDLSRSRCTLDSVTDNTSGSKSQWPRITSVDLEV